MHATVSHVPYMLGTDTVAQMLWSCFLAVRHSIVGVGLNHRIDEYAPPCQLETLLQPINLASIFSRMYLKSSLVDVLDRKRGAPNRLHLLWGFWMGESYLIELLDWCWTCFENKKYILQIWRYPDHLQYVFMQLRIASVSFLVALENSAISFLYMTCVIAGSPIVALTLCMFLRLNCCLGALRKHLALLWRGRKINDLPALCLCWVKLTGDKYASKDPPKESKIER